ncbi:MAG TPA: hypothetical protein VHC22_23825 [Pirellulales bacterium]|nr:hypothetical protein [Pirellulales bacterium]
MQPKLQSRGRYRPRILTLVTIAVGGTPLVLANLSSDIEGGDPLSKAVHGWPFVWHWHNLAFRLSPPFRVPGIYSWDFSPGWLLANLAIWLLLLVAPAAACEWALRRYRPGPRWSLRTMLIAISLASAGCGWYATARNRVALQDQLIEADRNGSVKIWLQRSGPKWLAVIGAERWWSYILAAEVWAAESDQPEEVEARLKLLAGLPKLRYLSLQVPALTPEMLSSLGQMRHLSELRIEGGYDQNADDDDNRQVARECLIAVSHIPGLEYLHLGDMDLAGEDLSRLHVLKKLTSISFHSVFDGWDVPIAETPSLLKHLPALPSLEAIDLDFCRVSEDDLRHLATLPRLRALGLRAVFFPEDAPIDLAVLANIPSLEELALEDELVSPSVLKSLQGHPRLEKLHLEKEWRHSRQSAAIELDHGDELFMERGDASYVVVLEGLRAARPGIVIDPDVKAVAWNPAFNLLPGYHPLGDIHSHPDDLLRNTPWLTPSQKAQIDAQSKK